MISLRWFVEVMHEGAWQRVAVCNTLAEAERAADEIYEETNGRDVRYVHKRSTAACTPRPERGNA